MYSSRFLVSCLLFSTAAAVQKLSAEPIEAHGKAPATKKREKAMLHIGVSSAANDTDARQSIRDCWWKHELMQGDNPKVTAHFMVAKPKEGSIEKKILDKDMAEHPDDFLQVDAPEGYRNLTAKTIAYFRWAAEDDQAHFYMKLDDNNYPNIQFMYDHFRESMENGTRYQYAGEIISGWYSCPWGKYMQDWNVWPAYKTYPDYANGDGYVVAADLVKVVYQDQFEVNRNVTLDNEDVNNGYWIDNALKSGVNVTYQLMPERIDFSCNLDFGRDEERCCAADKSDPGQDWPNYWNSPGLVNTDGTSGIPRQWQGGKTLQDLMKEQESRRHLGNI